LDIQVCERFLSKFVNPSFITCSTSVVLTTSFGTDLIDDFMQLGSDVVFSTMTRVCRIATAMAFTPLRATSYAVLSFYHTSQHHCAVSTAVSWQVVRREERKRNKCTVAVVVAAQSPAVSTLLYS
jgi:hypothetical protein